MSSTSAPVGVQPYTLGIGHPSYSADPAAPAITSGNSSSLEYTLRNALATWEGKSAYDTYGQTASKVASVTVGATLLSGGVVKNAFDAGAYDYLRIYGAAYRAGFTGYTGLVLQNSGGYPIWQNPTGPGTAAENLRGQHMRVRFKAKQIQIKCRGFGLTTDYFPMWLDDFSGGGFKRVDFTAGTIASDGYIQIDLTKYAEYELAVGMEQSLSVGAVVLDSGGEFVSVAPAVAIVVPGDSYVRGTVSPGVTGSDPCLCGAMSHISGLNVIPLGVTDTGYVASAYPITHPERLALITTVTNAAGAPLIMPCLGTNDVGQSSVAVKNAAIVLLDHLLSNTSAAVLIPGAQPRNLNNSAGIQAVDAGLAEAVSAVNSDRVLFRPIAGAVPPYIYGTNDTNTTGGVPGNSRWITGDDGTHLSRSFVADGTEFYARLSLSLALGAAKIMGW